MKKILLPTFLLINATFSFSQILTREDSLNAGLSPSAKSVVLSGYGEAKYSYDKNFNTAKANLTRNVLFMGYKFNSKISFFSEIEIEDALLDGDGGELGVEQCALKFNLNRNHYFLTGLIIPRIGIMNENHLPVTFNGNDRHMVEQLVIPSTWRELGIGYYGTSNKIAGLNWSVALLNGLNAEGIAGPTGLKDARFEGRDATASNLAATGALLYYIDAFRFQLSGYYGGSVGLSPRAADSLGLNSGIFGTPVSLGEFNVQYSKKGISVKALAAYGAVSDADKLNTAYATNATSSLYGYFIEAGYNLLETSKWKEKQLNLFVRYEAMDLMASIPVNGIKDELHNQEYVVTGLTFLPIRNVAIKFDWKYVKTGIPNPALIFNPGPNTPPYKPENSFFQLGMAYSF